MCQVKKEIRGRSLKSRRICTCPRSALKPAIVIVALKALLLLHGYRYLLNKGQAEDTSFVACMHGNFHAVKASSTALF